MLGVRGLELNLGVVLKCLVDVTQTRRALNVLWNRETKTHSFTLLDVGILAYNHNFQIVERHMLKSVKDQLFRRIDLLSLVLISHELEHLLECWSL